MFQIRSNTTHKWEKIEYSPDGGEATTRTISRLRPVSTPRHSVSLALLFTYFVLFLLQFICYMRKTERSANLLVTLQRVSKSFRSIIVSKTSASFAMSVSNCFRSIPVCVCGSFETEDIGSFADLINFASMLYIFMCSSMNCDTRYCFRSGFSLESFSD